MKKTLAALILSHILILSLSLNLLSLSKGLTYLPLIHNWRESSINGGFEAGQWHETRWWAWPWKTAYTGQFNEIRPGQGWTAWWVDNMFCPYNERFKTGRPEVLVIDLRDGLPDPDRVHSGNRALKWFTFWRCHLGGIYQRVSVAPGVYRVQAYTHSWYTECSAITRGRPRDHDCNLITDPWAYARIAIGLDQSGGEDYYATSIAWSEPQEIYDGYQLIQSPPVASNGTMMTIWIRSETSAPLKHEDLYVDDVVLFRVE